MPDDEESQLFSLIAKEAPEDDETDPAEDSPADEKPKRAALSTPTELVGLAKVSPPDAREIFTRVRSSSWVFMVFVEDPAAELENDSSDALDGMVKAFPRWMPITHAQPGVLSWLQENGHTGGIALCLKPRGTKKKADEYELLLHIPERKSEQDQNQQPAPNNGQQQIPFQVPQQTGGVALLSQMLMQMQQSSQQQMQVMMKFMTDMSEQGRQLQADTINRFESMLEDRDRDDPLRDLGVRMHTQALEQVTDKLKDMGNGGLEGVKRQIKQAKQAEDEIAKLAPDKKEEDDEIWLFAKEMGKDYVREKMMPGSGDRKVQKMLEGLQSQGDDILGSTG